MYCEVEVRIMRIQEVCHQLQLTKKAIYYYEKQGLLHIKKDNNGYRCFTQEDIERLNEIIVYRKWDISILDIRSFIDLPIAEKRSYLKRIYDDEQKKCHIKQEQLKQWLSFIENEEESFANINQQLDYQSLLQALENHIPGIYGYFLICHFEPYLHISMTSLKQKAAYQKILCFLDDFHIKLPLVYRLCYWFQKDHSQFKQSWDTIDDYKKELLRDENAYQKMKELCEKNVKMSKKWWYRLLNYPQRVMKIRLRDAGYYDIFIPAMMELSHDYKLYYQQWLSLNQRVCQELGIYYDSKFRLQKKS